MNTTQQRVIPADVYDTIEFVALAYGGIGRGVFARSADGAHVSGHDPQAHYPVCAYGIAQYAGVDDPYPSCLSEYLWLGIGTDENDRAVAAINRRKGRFTNARVTFREWAKELGVVRGT